MSAPQLAAPVPTSAETIFDLFQQLTWMGRHVFARRIEKVGLTVAQYRVLSSVNKQGPATTMGELSDGLLLPKSSLTSIANRLVALGLVERAPVANDRRAVGVTITPSGLEIVTRIEEERMTDLTSILEGMPEENIEHFAYALSRLVLGMEQLLAQPILGTGARS